MALPETDQLRIEKQFDCYSKKILKRYARDACRKMKRRLEREWLFSDLPSSVYNLAQMDVLDEHSFTAMNTPISIESDTLSEALRVLSKKQRMIILLFYFLDMNDREISEHLHSCRSSVQYTRTRTLKEMRKLIEKQKQDRKF